MAEKKMDDDQQPDAAQTPPAPDPAPAPVQRVRPMMPEELRQEEARAQNDILAEVQERDAVNGPEGGKYLIGADAQGKGGTFVDAEGKPLKDRKD